MDIDIFSILPKECCEVNLKFRRKDKVLREIASIAKRSDVLADISEETIYELLKAREEQGSTGIGGGLAIPHTAVPGLENFLLVLAISRRGVNFDAIDRKKVHIIAAIFGPEGMPKLHLQLLAQLSHTLKDENVRRELMKSPTSLSLYESFMRQARPTKATQGEGVCKRKVVFLTLQKSDLFEDIIEYLAELGLSGATVVESKGIRSILSGLPLFADFIRVFGDSVDENRIIIFTIHENLLDDVVEGIEKITGDLSKHTGAMIMVIEPVLLKGTLELI
ncbi:hypothetical protein DRQ26_00965 [bacterium]|nr:MAG: hypothetical protein DRQ26_00965 [bacterium]